MEHFRILELFSGIGGMHYAFRHAELPGEVVMAMDINTIANKVYAHNHNNTPVKNNNIQSLTSKQIEKLAVNMVLMSPPCQPHTRQGLQKDIDDHRSDALCHICELLPTCSSIRYVLMENVKGFEGSRAHTKFLETLKSSGFFWREFILTPTQFGVPNTRHRYYCIARKSNDFEFEGIHIWERIPNTLCSSPTTIEGLLEAASEEFLLSSKVLDKRVWVLDIVHPKDTNTMCFTKGYTHYSEGTGSVFSTQLAEKTNEIFAVVKSIEEELAQLHDNTDIEQLQVKRMKLLQSLKLRYFTPREVGRLMSFPENFDFPSEISLKQKYRLLGNSINVIIVGLLLKTLTTIQ